MGELISLSFQTETITFTDRQNEDIVDKQTEFVHYLNFIYFTLITQEAHRTYIRVLEGVMWSNVVEETGEPNLDGRPLPCHMPRPGFEPGSPW